MSVFIERPTIAVDIDDVLTASAPAVVEYGNARWGTRLTVDDYDDHWGKMFNIDNETLRVFAEDYLGSGAIGRLPHHEDAVRVLRRLHETYRLVITTSRQTFLRDETVMWVDEHFAGVFDEVRFAGFFDDAMAYRHSATKAELAKEIGASYIIDDQLKHCLAAAEVGIPALLFGDYSWNREPKVLPPGIVRVASWSAVQEYFDGQRSRQ